MVTCGMDDTTTFILGGAVLALGVMGTAAYLSQKSRVENLEYWVDGNGVVQGLIQRTARLEGFVNQDSQYEDFDLAAHRELQRLMR